MNGELVRGFALFALSKRNENECGIQKTDSEESVDLLSFLFIRIFFFES